MAEKAKIDLLIEGAQAATTLGELKVNAENLTVALEEAELGSKAYKKLNQQLIQTNKQVKDLELGFEALDQEGVASELGSVAGAIGDITAATILLGGENETLERMASNIELALGVSLAFKGAIEGAQSARKLWNNVLKKSNVIVKIQIVLQRILNTVMKANPIGLIIIAVTALIGVFALLAGGVGKLGEKFTDIGKKLKSQTDRLGKYKNALLLLLGPIGLIIIAWNFLIELQEKFKSQSEKDADSEKRLQKARSRAANKRHLQRLRDIEAEREAENDAHNQRQTQFDLDIDRMDANGENSFALRKQKIEDLIAEEEAVFESNAAKIASWSKYYEELAAFSGKSREDFIAELKGQGIDLIAMQGQAEEFQKAAQDRIFAARTKLIGLERAEFERIAAEAEQRGADALAKEKEMLDALAAERELAAKLLVSCISLVFPVS